MNDLLQCQGTPAADTAGLHNEFAQVVNPITESARAHRYYSRPIAENERTRNEMKKKRKEGSENRNILNQFKHLRRSIRLKHTPKQVGFLE